MISNLTFDVVIMGKLRVAIKSLVDYDAVLHKGSVRMIGYSCLTHPVFLPCTAGARILLGGDEAYTTATVRPLCNKIGHYSYIILG